MRYDHLTTANSNFEQSALYCDQMIAFMEHEISKLKAARNLFRSMASTDPAEGDPAVDLKPFALPSVAKKTPEQQRQEYSRQPLRATLGSTMSQNQTIEQMEADIAKATTPLAAGDQSASAAA